eukprot:g23269.t1
MFDFQAGEAHTWSGTKKDWCCDHFATGCPYECTGGDDWTSWDSAKQTWCCDNQGRGCQKFHCEGETHEKWSAEKKSWCCDNYKTGCGTYDCDYKKDEMDTHWSYSKRAYCCIKEEKGCAGGSESKHFDCAEDFGEWESNLKEKQAWCCDTHLRGCPKSNTPKPYSCELEDGASWEGMWSSEQKSWCCTHEKVACDHFDCELHLSYSDQLWSAEKKTWCCSEKKAGCVTFDCDGEEDPHEAAWSEERKSFCCKEHGKFCGENEDRFHPLDSKKFECNTAGQSFEKWDTDEKHWCCDHFTVGCESFDCALELEDLEKATWKITILWWELFDCDDGLDAWEHKWSPLKKGWCCKYASKACDPFDCAPCF